MNWMYTGGLYRLAAQAWLLQIAFPSSEGGHLYKTKHALQANLILWFFPTSVIYPIKLLFSWRINYGKRKLI